MNSLNLNNVISTGENTFIVRMSLLELKNIIDFDVIEIDCEKDVPYIPLEDEATIYLNIDKKNLYYNKETKVLNVNDKFRVMDGEIRLIDFVNNTDWYEDKMECIITLNIVCCDISQARELLSNSNIVVDAWQKDFIKVSDESRKCKNNNIPEIKINKKGIEEISNKIIKGDR